MRKFISTHSEFEKLASYSRAVVQEDMCFVSGTTGYDYNRMEMPEDVVQQTRNCLETINRVMVEAGFLKEDIIKATYVITDANYAGIVFPVLGEYFRDIMPSATMIVAGLIRPEMKIEIEVMALRQGLKNNSNQGIRKT